MADRGKEIENLTIIRIRITYAIGGNHRKLERLGDADSSLVAPFFLSLTMSLQFDINIFAAKDARQPFDGFAPGFFSATHQCGG